MNKGKLRSLMFHAGFCNEDGGWDNRPIWEQEHDNFQRFAELIVRECIDVLVTEMNRLDGLDRVVSAQTMDTAQVLIKQHFGVEE